MSKLFLAILMSFAFLHLEGMPAQVLIIRHAEKTGDGNALSQKGKERSAAYVPYFAESKDLFPHGPLTAIYVVKPSSDDASHLPTETMQALADKEKISLKSFAPENLNDMIEEIKSSQNYKGKSVLICWEHSAISDIARGLGALQVPSKWPQEAHDRIWKITFGGWGGKPQFQNTPQKLLYGDSSI